MLAAKNRSVLSIMLEHIMKQSTITNSPVLLLAILKKIEEEIEDRIVVSSEIEKQLDR